MATGSVAHPCYGHEQLPAGSPASSMMPTTFEQKIAGSQATRLGQVARRLSEEPLNPTGRRTAW
jgi:hypothetical protein